MQPLNAVARTEILRQALRFYGAPLHHTALIESKEIQTIFEGIPGKDFGEADPSNISKGSPFPLMSQEEKDQESELAAAIEGYQPGDLWALARRTAMEAARGGSRKGYDVLGNNGSEKSGRQGNVLHTTFDMAITSAKEFSHSSSHQQAGTGAGGASPVHVTWSDIGGLHKAKQAIIDLFQLPVIYRKLFQLSPIRMPRAILLYGPPGCGKTVLAQAAASECGLAFISIRGT